jgi:hypothetical protein
MLKAKVLLLSGALALVVYLVHSLNTGGLSLILSDSSQLDWCHSRVVEIAEKNPVTSYRIYEKGTVWVVDGDRHARLEKTVMEKWLARYCRFPVDSSGASPKGELKPLGTVTVKLLNGENAEFDRFSEGIHRYKDGHGGTRWFKSNDWDVALSQLATLGT